MRNFPEMLIVEGIHHRDIKFRDALFSLRENDINEQSAIYIEKIYKDTKLPEIRNKCIKLLYNKHYAFLENFFLFAYKKERYLDMKIIALRGLAQFLSEESICLLIQKFNETLVKRPEKTPYNYQEYELLKGKHALPYLIDRYGYKCLKETLKITNKNYDRMPDAFKGHWTTDENGEITWLRSPEESSGMMSDFFEKLRWRK